MKQCVKFMTHKYDASKGRSEPAGEVTVSIEIDVEKLARHMYVRGRKTIADGLVKLRRLEG